MVRVGTSGYVYRDWRGVLYPPGLPAARWLPHYARVFRTVELNATFYRLPTEKAARAWAAAVPRGFHFAAKGSRYLTHMKKLRETGEGLERFFTPLAGLGASLRWVLWQLPPQLAAPDLGRLEAFLEALGPYRQGAFRRVKHALEVRSAAWYTEPVCALLDRHRVALCEHDLVERRPPRPTGGWRYLRFHGASAKYAGRYGPAALAPFAEDLAAWRDAGHEAVVYFNNDVGGHAVHDALTLLELLGEPVAELSSLAP